jgi:hypothetical protein
MAGEVSLRPEAGREGGRPRGPAVRTLLALTVAAGLLAVATMVYGVYHFPDAPIRRTEGGYSGKGGKPRTREDFESFVLWEKAMFIVFPSVFLLGFAFGIADSMRRRRRTS